MQNGRNVALISPRRLGKTGLIHHFFHQADVREQFRTFFIDIYATSSLAELVCLSSRTTSSHRPTEPTASTTSSSPNGFGQSTDIIRGSQGRTIGQGAGRGCCSWAACFCASPHGSPSLPSVLTTKIAVHIFVTPQLRVGRSDGIGLIGLVGLIGNNAACSHTREQVLARRHTRINLIMYYCVCSK